jgi:hypothetical protein
MSYGTDLADSFRQIGVYRAPSSQSAKFEFIINLHTARALGIEVPTLSDPLEAVRRVRQNRQQSVRFAASSSSRQRPLIAASLHEPRMPHGVFVRLQIRTRHRFP